MVIHSYLENDPEYHRQSPEIGLLDIIETKETYKVLDIGCGCGKQSYALSSKVASVIGIDLQQFMIDHAKTKFSNENVTYLCEDFMTSELIEDSFDIIICQNVMFHIKDKESFLKKVLKLLKRGGCFYFTDLTSHEEVINEENLAYPVSPNYYSTTLNKLGFSNVMFYFEKHWIWDGQYSGKNYAMFKCSK